VRRETDRIVPVELERHVRRRIDDVATPRRRRGLHRSLTSLDRRSPTAATAPAAAVIRLDVADFTDVVVVAVDAGVLRFGIKDVEIRRIDRRLESVPTADALPHPLLDATVVANGARSTPRPVVLKPGADIVGPPHVDRRVIRECD